jgi:hypothetical protein
LATAGSQEFTKLACGMSAAFISKAKFLQPRGKRLNHHGATPIGRAETQPAAAALNYAAGLAG